MKKSSFSLLVLLWLLLLVLPVGAQSPIVTPTPPGDGGGLPDALPPVALSGTWIAAFLAAALSFGLAYIPGAASWWGGFGYKREAFLGAGVVVALALVGLHYAGAVDLGLGAWGWSVVERWGRAVLEFLGAAQGAFIAQQWLAARKAGKAGNV
jgi:hypothetical protein